MVFKKTTCVMLSALMLGSTAVLPVRDCFAVRASAAPSGEGSDRAKSKTAVTEISALTNATGWDDFVCTSNGLVGLRDGKNLEFVVYDTYTNEAIKHYDDLIDNSKLIGVTRGGDAIVICNSSENLVDLFYKGSEDYEELKAGYNSDADHILLFDDDTKPPKLIEVPSKCESWSADDEGNVYYKNEGTFYHMALYDGTAEPYTVREISDCLDYNRLHEVYADTVNGTTARAPQDFRVIDAKTDEVKWTKPFYNSNYFAELKIIDNAVITYGAGKNPKFDKPMAPLRCYDIDSGKFLTSFYLPEDAKPVFSEQSPYILLSYEDAAPADEVTFISPYNSRRCTLDCGMTGITSVDGFCVSTEEWMIKVSDGTTTKYFIIDLTKADFTDIKEVRPELSEVGPELKEVRKRADALEEKYGIDIVMGNEVNECLAWDYCSFEPYINDEDIYHLLNDLDELDMNMSKYPEGFFRQFVNSDGTGGYVLCLSYAYYDDGSLYNWFLGNTQVIGDYYMVTGSLDFANGWAFFHENWHAVECRVSRDYPLNNDEWDALNPDDFEYFAVWDPANEGKDYPKYRVTGEDPYFMTYYCMGSGVEDRAIMMGQILNLVEVTEFTCEDPTARYEYIKKNFPHIHAKIDYMADWSKQLFGYVYFTSILGLPDDEFDSKVIGDINEDEKLDIEDAVMMVNHINGVSALNKFQENKGDVDGNSTIDIEDVAMMINDINGVSPLKK